MEKFFELYEQYGGFVLEVGHNSVSDWCIFIWHGKGR